LNFLNHKLHSCNDEAENSCLAKSTFKKENINDQTMSH